MATPGIGLIGCGFIGRFHSIAIRSLIRHGLIDANYVAVCDLDPERAQSFAALTGASLVTPDWREVVDSPEVGIVYVCTPTAAHKEIVLHAAESGKHVFCEKPLATNLTDVEQMAVSVRRSGVGAAVGLVLRHSLVFTVLKALTEDPALGRLMTIVFRDDQFFPIQGHYQSDWRKDRDLAGSGTLLEHSIHDVDILRWFAGEVVSVSGHLRNFAGHEGVEDLAVAHLDFSGGAKAELISVWHNVVGRPSSRNVELFFENGVFQVDNDFSGPIHYQSRNGPPSCLTEEEVQHRYLQSVGFAEDEVGEVLGYSLEDYFFLSSVAAGTDPFPDFEVALEAHRVIDAIYRSAAAGGAEVRLG